MDKVIALGLASLFAFSSALACSNDTVNPQQDLIIESIQADTWSPETPVEVKKHYRKKPKPKPKV